MLAIWAQRFLTSDGGYRPSSASLSATIARPGGNCSLCGTAGEMGRVEGRGGGATPPEGRDLLGGLPGSSNWGSPDAVSYWKIDDNSERTPVYENRTLHRI